jgi:deoxyribodipyrimidine photo-lyase
LLPDPPAWRWDASEFRRWARGQTGLPLADAAARELARTGVTSNRCRQCSASLLACDLRLDWRAGAELYECLLVDHEWSANRGNWAYVAGVGAGGKARRFRTAAQGLRYDPGGTFVRAWVPELAAAPSTELAHQPWLAAAEGEAGAAEPWAGWAEYPAPMVPPETQC